MKVSIRSDCCIALRMIALQAWYASEQELWEIEMGFWQNEKIEKQEAEILRLRADNAKLRAALKPFADAADDFIAEKHDAHRAIVTLGDLRAAAAALKETGDE